MVRRPQSQHLAWAAMSAPSFQDLIARLQAYWSDNGCVVMQPYHT